MRDDTRRLACVRSPDSESKRLRFEVDPEMATFATNGGPNLHEQSSQTDLKDHQQLSLPRCRGHNPCWALSHQVTRSDQAKSRSSNSKNANNNAAPLYNTQ